MAIFESWSNLHQDMLDALASGNWRESQFSYGGRNSASRDVQFRSLDEFMKALDYVKNQAAIETGQFRGRRSMGGVGI